MKKWKKVLKTIIHGAVLIVGLWAGIYIAFGGSRNIRQHIWKAVKNAEVQYVEKVSQKALKHMEDYLSTEQVRAAVGTLNGGIDTVKGDFEFSYEGFGTVAASVTYCIPGNNELALFYQCSGDKGQEITYDFILGANGRIKKAEYSGRGMRAFDYRTVAYDGEIFIGKKEIDDVVNQILNREEEIEKEEDKRLLYNKDGKKSLGYDKVISNDFTVSFRIYEKEAPARELLSFAEAGTENGFVWVDGYDYNFDGWYDLCLETEQGPHYFIWNPSTRNYDRKEELEALKTPVFDPISQCIYVEEANPWTITRYSYKENVPKEVSKVICLKEGENWLMECWAQSPDGFKQLSKETWITEEGKKKEVFMRLSAYDFIYGMNHAKTFETMIEKNQILKLLLDTSVDPVLTFAYPYSITIEMKPDPELSEKYFGLELPMCTLTFFLEDNLTFENNYLLSCEGFNQEPVMEKLAALQRRIQKKQKPIPESDREYVAEMGKDLETFRFYFTGLGERNDRAGLVYYRYWLTVYEGEKKEPVQSMLLETTMELKASFVDFNFDGVTDFYFDQYGTDSKGPGERVYYVWNKENRQFVPENYGLSDLSDLTLLPGDRLILENQNRSNGLKIRRAYEYGEKGLETVWAIEVKDEEEGILEVFETLYKAGKQTEIREYQFPETELKNPGNQWLRKWKQ